MSVTNGSQAKELRMQRGLNQSEFWNRIGVTQSGGSRYESGRDMGKPVKILLNLCYSTPKKRDALMEWLREGA